MPLHHTALEFKRHWGPAELQEVREKTEERQDEEQRGRDRLTQLREREGEGVRNRGHTMIVISHSHLHILSETLQSIAGFKNSGWKHQIKGKGQIPPSLPDAQDRGSDSLTQFRNHEWSKKHHGHFRTSLYTSKIEV